MDSKAAPSALGALSAALLGCPLTQHQLGVLTSRLRSRAAQVRLALPALVYLPFESGPARSAGELEQALRGARIRAHALPLTSVPPQGTHAMGKDSYRSVVRSTGEIWEAPGAFVADASVFPTSIGVPPQVTIMALAGVIADHVADELKA